MLKGPAGVVGMRAPKAVLKLSWKFKFAIDGEEKQDLACNTAPPAPLLGVDGDG
jgi:hypothetical protein